jgi:CO dehydrogenase/acetyl-CoA synthase alpha subunit
VRVVLAFILFTSHLSRHCCECFFGQCNAMAGLRQACSQTSGGRAPLRARVKILDCLTVATVTYNINMVIWNTTVVMVASMIVKS